MAEFGQGGGRKIHFWRGSRFKSCSSHSLRGLGTVDQQIRGLIRIGLSGPTLFPCEYAVLP